MILKGYALFIPCFGRIRFDGLSHLLKVYTQIREQVL